VAETRLKSRKYEDIWFGKQKNTGKVIAALFGIFYG
jgi:hypothetical protein